MRFSCALLRPGAILPQSGFLPPPERMRSLPTLRRELLMALALVFMGALLVATIGVILIVPGLTDPLSGTLYIGFLLAADMVVFLWFGRWLVQKRVLAPIQRMLEGVEAIAGGNYAGRLPQPASAEMARFAGAVNG